jgi:hypothetical protein
MQPLNLKKFSLTIMILGMKKTAWQRQRNVLHE